MGTDNPQARYLSNKTHYSPDDPDARVAVKPGKPRQQKYYPDKMYFTIRRDCIGWPLASGWIGKSHEKRINMTVYKDYYDRAMERAKSRKGKYYKIVRQSMVEPVFCTLIICCKR